MIAVRSCSFAECDRAARSGSALYCDVHYRQRREGKPLTAIVRHFTSADSLADRLAANTNRPAEAEGCWEWTAGGHSRGYGVMRDPRDGVMKLAHRLSYEVATGHLIPSDMQIDHLCRNKLCQRIEHLELVTAEENSRRAAADRGMAPEDQNRLVHA